MVHGRLIAMTRYRQQAMTRYRDNEVTIFTRGTMGTKKTTRIIAVGNQKGGVGKTTTAVHIAAALGERGRLCLLWDLDMAHNTTKQFGIPPDSFLGTFEVLIDAEKAADVILKPGEVEGVELPANVHIIPSKRKLEAIAQVLAERDKFRSPQDVLLEPLASLDGVYDYIILDTGPNATLPTVAAYKAAHYFILSAQPEPWAVEGLGDALRDIQAAQRQGNARLKLLGVALGSVHKRTRLAAELTDYVDRIFGDRRDQPTISKSTIVPDSQKERMTVFKYAPNHPICDQYRELAREIEERIAKDDAVKLAVREAANG
jgi:chromosome partitioning protein